MIECVCQWNVFSGAENHPKPPKVEQQMKYFRRRCLPPTQNFKDNMKVWLWISLKWQAGLDKHFECSIFWWGEQKSFYLHDINLRIDSQSHDRAHSRLKWLVLPLTHSIHTVKYINANVLGYQVLQLSHYCIWLDFKKLVMLTNI